MKRLRDTIQKLNSDDVNDSPQIQECQRRYSLWPMGNKQNREMRYASSKAGSGGVFRKGYRFGDVEGGVLQGVQKEEGFASRG